MNFKKFFSYASIVLSSTLMANNAYSAPPQAVVCTLESLVAINAAQNKLTFTFKSDGSFENDFHSPQLSMRCVANYSGAYVSIASSANNGSILNESGIIVGMYPDSSTGTGEIPNVTVGGSSMNFNRVAIPVQNVTDSAQLNPYLYGRDFSVRYVYISSRDSSKPVPSNPQSRNEIMGIWQDSRGNALHTKEGATGPVAPFYSAIIFTMINIRTELICPSDRIDFHQSKNKVDFGRLSSDDFPINSVAPVKRDTFSVTGIRKNNIVNAACADNDTASVSFSLVGGGKLDSRQQSVILDNGLKIQLFKDSNTTPITFNNSLQMFTLNNQNATATANFEAALSRETTSSQIKTGEFETTIKMLWSYP